MTAEHQPKPKMPLSEAVKRSQQFADTMISAIGENFVLDDPEMATEILGQLGENIREELSKEGKDTSQADMLNEDLLRAISIHYMRRNFEHLIMDAIRQGYEIDIPWSDSKSDSSR